MTETLNPVKNTTFVGDFTKWEKLAVETCPGYNAALEEAKASYYEHKVCQDCQICRVVYDPNTRTVRIRGKCSKT